MKTRAGRRLSTFLTRAGAVVLGLVAIVPGGALAGGSPGPSPTDGAIDSILAGNPDPNAQAAGQTRPNIVIVMLDDLPADIMPRLIERMPRADALFARRGLRFRHFYAQDPLCCPSRVGFLTGLHAHHHGVRRNIAKRFHPGASLATALDGVGYHTILVGKYLNNANQLPDPTPPGWDRVAMTGQAGYYDYTLVVDGLREKHGHRPTDYTTDVLRRHAVGALRQAPADQPVFLYWAPVAAHNVERGHAVGPPPPAPRHRRSERCSGIGYRRTPAYDERDVSDKPRWIRRLDYRQDPFFDRLGYPLGPVCRVLLAVDEGLDAIVAELRVQGRYEDTIFVLTADNGMGWGDHRRRAKSVPWATPIPFYLRWREGLGDQPATIGTWAQNIDLAPTLVEAAGATLGPFPTGQEVPDGTSLLNAILSRGALAVPRQALLEDHKDPPGSPVTWQALRTTDQHPLGLWHFIEWRSGEHELYDLVRDPWELENLASSRPDIAAALQTELLSLLLD